jgi:hypothetical protein
MTPRLRWVAAAAVALATACTGKSGPPGSVEGTITGFVRMATGPLAGATVNLLPGEIQATSAADGSFTLRAPVGVYTLTAQAPGYQAMVSDPISVVAGGLVEIGLTLTPEAPAPVQADAGRDRFQAGFGAQVRLDGTKSAGAGISYTWEQVPRSGPEVVLDDPASPTPSFTTKTLEELEAGGFYAIRRSLGNLGFSEADVDRSTYEFELTVTDGVTASTDRVIVRSVVGQPGLRVVPVETVVPISAGDQAGYDWTCTFQDNDGNRAPCAPGVLSRPTTRTPSLRADRIGLYTLTTPGEAPLELRSATYVGAREVAGVQTCFSCHRSRHDAWAGTRHATYLQRALSGNLVDKTGQHVTYRGECMRCHTTGFNPDAVNRDVIPAIVNGGFTQVAAAESWGFPNTFEAMSPQLQALASVTCENCHGPGSLHRDAPSRLNIGKSFAAVDCSQCHATEPYENQGLQWVNSRHSQFVSGFRPEAGDPALRGFCASCHSSPGFVAWTDSGVTTAPPVSADVTEPQTCTACHDQHGEATFGGLPTPNMLRLYGDVTTLVPGLGARGVGPAALCMTCHNSRTSVTVATEATIAAPASQAAPHTPSQADVLLAKNAATFGGSTYPSSVHTGVPKLCVGCHMAPTPPIGAAGHNLVGGHSFAVKAGALVNTGACTSCHAGLDGFNRTAYGDYDGDGFLEGVQTEVTGLEALVQEQLSLAAARLWPVETGGGTPAVVKHHGQIRVLKDFVPGTSAVACSPAADPEGWEAAGCFAFAAPTTPPTPGTGLPQNTTSETDFLKAAWNYFLIQGDRSRGIHNTAFAVSVLQRSYQALAGQPVPGAIIR